MKLCGLKLKRYGASLIDLNVYLAVFPGSKASDKKFETGFNITFLKRHAKYMELASVCIRFLL